MQISETTLRFIEEHIHTDIRTLALRAQKYPDVDMNMAVTQISGRKIAEIKIPSWYQTSDIWYPKHLSMEQCSSEATALYKASLIQGSTLVDLTGGFGIDCAFLSQSFHHTDYVERQSELCQLAEHNFPLLGLNIEVHNEDGVEYLNRMQPVDCIYLDPARRDGHGGKTIAISDCEPDVSILEEVLLEKAETVMVKLSPMLDITLALKAMKSIHEVHIVSVNNECKELLLILRRCPVQSVIIHCEHILSSGEHQHYVFTSEEEKQSACPLANEVKTYLYEPNASIMKAGAYRMITQDFPVSKLHANSHLYTSDEYVVTFPGRKFKIEAISGFGKKDLKALMLDIEKANLTIRNFPSSVAELRKRLKLKEGGEVYLFATTLADEEKVLIKCTKVQ